MLPSASILPAVQPEKHSEWDREADLESIRDAYESYDRTARARLWDERAPGYARMAADLQVALIGSVTASLPSHRPRIIDVGCGDGAFVKEASRAGIEADWTGIDLRPGAIVAAQRRYPEGTFLVASADAIPLETHGFDAAVSRVLFSSLPSAALEAAVAAEIGRLLRPGGWLAWLDIRWSNPSNPHVHGLSEGRIAALFPGWKRELRSAGLLPPVARRLGKTTRFAYPALAAIPLMRSHLVGRLQHPDETDGP